MTPTLRAELDRIGEFLQGPEGNELAAVLAALRGPDETPLSSFDNSFLKDETTVHIRRAAFPRLATRYDAHLAVHPSGRTWAGVGSWTLVTKRPFNAHSRSKSQHFTNHIEDAAYVLDMVTADEAPSAAAAFCKP